MGWLDHTWMIDTVIPPARPYLWVSFDTANMGLNLAPTASASVTLRASAAGLAMRDHSALLTFGVGGGEVGLAELLASSKDVI